MDKKYINKAGFKSFFKNKTGAILLAIIVFLSATTFTVLQSSVSNYTKSYDHIMAEGKLHDYTMKESYKATGDVKYEVVKKDPNKADESKYVGSDTPYTNSQYMVMSVGYFRNGGILSSFNEEIVKKATTTEWSPNINSLSLDLKKMEIKDSNKDGKIDENDTIKYQNKRIYGKVTSDSDHKIDTSNINSILGSSTSSDIYIDLDNMKIKNASDGTDYAYKPGAPSTFIGKTTASEFKAEVLKAIKLINHKSANAIHSSLVNNYVIKPNIAHTSGDFQFEYDSNNNLYTEDIFGIAISTANIRNPIIQNIINSKTDLMRSNVINHKSANFIKKMKKEILSKFNTNLISKKISSVNIYDSGNAVKVVDSSENNLVDKIVLNSGTGLINSSIGTNASIKLKLDAKMKKFVDSKNAIRPQYYPKINPTNMKYRYDEKWRYSLEFTFGVLPQVVSIIDPSSFGAVVSPSYASYHSLSPINKSFFKSKEFLDAASDQTDTSKMKRLTDKYKDNVVKVGTLTYFVTGIGISPDFSYPIVSPREPVVNIQKQAIIFTNQAGFMRAKSSFNSAEEENYVGLRFKENISWEKKQSIINYIEKEAHSPTGMNFPKNIRILSKFDDVSEKIIMAPQRVSFLSKLNKTINTISWVTIIGLIALTTLIVIVSIKRIISSERKTLAIANANGYSKWTIAGSYIPGALLVVGTASLLGYMGGVFLQPLFAKIFSNFWTIPLSAVHVSIPSLILTTVVPVALIGLLVLVVVMSSMRGKVVDNLSDKESKMGQAFASVVMKSFKWAGIKSKVAVSFIVTNIGKMALIMGATSIGVAVVAVAFTSAGKFGYAITETKDVNRYEYAVDLVSPTKEGGMYHSVIQEDPTKPKLVEQYKDKPTRTWMGMQMDNSPNPKYGGIPTDKLMSDQFSTIPLTTFTGWTSYTHSPGVWDGFAYKDTPGYGWGAKDPSGVASMNYLKGKVQFKSFLNLEVGGAGQDTNAWDINKQLMPKNQQNLANADYLKYMQKIVDLPKNKTQFDTLDKIKSIDNLALNPKDIAENWYETLKKLLVAHKRADNSNKQVDKDIANKLDAKLPKELTFNAGLFKKIRKSYKQAIVNGFKAGIYPFVLTYDQISMDVDDETYTSIRGEAKFTSHGKQKLTSLSIKGINEDSKYIHVGGSNINALKNYKGNNTPVLINKYMEQFYGLYKGDTFDVDVKNTLDRYTNTSKHTKKMLVVGVVPSYANNEVITLRNIANHTLGYDLKEGFNGVFSAEKTPSSLKNVNLYSPSGLYPAFNTFNPNTNNEYKEVIEAFLKTSNARAKGLPATVTEFVTRYSNKIYQSTITDVEWARMDDFTFKSINKLSSALIVLVEVVALIIAIIFIVILGSIMLESNKRNISTLKVVGYRNSEIRNAFLKSLLPSLIFGTLIAIPIVFAVLIGMQFAIMGFGAVLIPLSMLGWELLAAALLVSLIFILIFTLSIRALKGQSALEAFKE